MKVRVAWGVRSLSLDQPLTEGCPHCGDSVGRLSQHRAGKRRGLTAPRRSVEGLAHAGIARKAARGAGAE